MPPIRKGRKEKSPSDADLKGLPLAALCDLLDSVGTAAILVNAAGEIVGISPTAMSYLGRELHVRSRRLVTDDSFPDDAVMPLIAKALDGAESCPREQVVVARGDGRPLIVRAVSLGGDPALFHPAHAMVILLDTGRAMLPTEAELEGIFRLSSAEARLAIRLASGLSLQEAASLRGVSYETARKRLRTVFAKTGTRRQAELVALVIRVGRLAGYRPNAPALGAVPTLASGRRRSGKT